MYVIKSLILMTVTIVALSHSSNAYYWYADNDQSSSSSVVPTEQSVRTTNKIEDAATQVVNQAQEQVSDTVSGHPPKRDEVRKQMSASLGSLVNKMPHAIKSAYQEISPDLQGLGDGLNKAIQMTRQDLAQRVEPLSHNMTPYLNRAQEVVRPYADEAQKRIGPAINPTIEKLRAGQYREAINDVGHQAAPHIDSIRNQVSGLLSRVSSVAANNSSTTSINVPNAASLEKTAQSSEQQSLVEEPQQSQQSSSA